MTNAIDKLYADFKAWTKKTEVDEADVEKFPAEWEQLKSCNKDFKRARGKQDTPATLRVLEAFVVVKKGVYQTFVDHRQRVADQAGTIFLQQRVDEYKDLLSSWLPCTLENAARVAINDKAWEQDFDKTNRHLQALKQTLDASTKDTKDWETYDNQVRAIKLEIRSICDHMVNFPLAAPAITKSPPRAAKRVRVVPASPPPAAAARRATSPAVIPDAEPDTEPDAEPDVRDSFKHLPVNWELYEEATLAVKKKHVNFMKTLAANVKVDLRLIMLTYPRNTHWSIYSGLDAAMALVAEIETIFIGISARPTNGKIHDVFKALFSPSKRSVEVFKVVRYATEPPAPDAPPAAAASAAASTEKADEADEAALAPPKGTRNVKGKGTARKAKGKPAPAAAADAAASDAAAADATPTDAAAAPVDDSDDEVFVVKKKPSSIRRRRADDSDEEAETHESPAKKARTLPAAADATPSRKRGTPLADDSDDDMDARIAAPTDPATAFQAAGAYDAAPAAAAASTFKKPKMLATAQELLARVRAGRALAPSSASESAGGWKEVPHPAAAAAFQDDPAVISGGEEEEVVETWG